MSCCFNVATNLKNVEAKEKYEKEVRHAAMKRKLQELPMDEDLYIPKEYPLFNQWLAMQVKVLFRQLTFVVDGDSYCGKSMFLKVKLPDTTYVCACRDVVDPDLKEYEGPPTHWNIMFDEGSPKMMSKHRDLFQASKHDVTLGTSATNCHSYKVNVYRVRLCITANDWKPELLKLNEKDRAWVERNTMVLNVDQYMFTREIMSYGQDPLPV